MKKVLLLAVTSSMLLSTIQSAETQVINRLKKKVSSKIENTLNTSIDKVFEEKESSGDVSSAVGGQEGEADKFV